MTVIYDSIGSGYNLTRKADPYLTSRLVYLLQPETGEIYLDIGCGTGNYTVALSNYGLNITGIEPSAAMLNEARKQSEKIAWLQGTAEQIPAKDDSFNGAIATLTVHHWTDLERSFNELSRVMKDGGTLIIFTATPEQMQEYWLNHYFPNMLRSSMINMPSFSKIKNALENAGFNLMVTEKYHVKTDIEDQFLYSGKHQPEIYFDDDVRKGISSFALSANADEIKTGLLKLRQDINSGKFKEVQDSYTDDRGDYLFIAAKKK